jgi:hypothetical protein
MLGRSKPRIGSVLKLWAPIFAALGAVVFGSVQNWPAINEWLFTPQIQGTWDVTDTIVRTDLPGYENLQIMFRITILQQGKTVKGTGEKIKEGERTIPVGVRSRLAIEGTLYGRRLRATFAETGTRQTSGDLDWRFSRNGQDFEGEWNSTAALSPGRSRGKRVSLDH